MTRNDAGTYSSTSVTSSPRLRSERPPQSGQTGAGSWRTTSRGRCGGGSCLAGRSVVTAEGTDGVADGPVAASVRVASPSSSASSSWAIARSSFSDEAPNRARFSAASCAFSRSISVSRESSAAAWARTIACRAAGSEGSASSRMSMTGVYPPMASRDSIISLNQRDSQATRPGGALQAGRRQSIPSQSIASCAAVSRATPSAGEGQGKRPFSSTL